MKVAGDYALALEISTQFKRIANQWEQHYSLKGSEWVTFGSLDVASGNQSKWAVHPHRH